jgi:hypothetical protein
MTKYAYTMIACSSMFMFVTILIHKVPHNEVVWYGQGACNNPELSGIKKEGSRYVEI